MTKQSALKQLNTIIGKLEYLNYHIEGNKLESAIRNAAYVRDSNFSVRKIIKAKK